MWRSSPDNVSKVSDGLIGHPPIVSYKSTWSDSQVIQKAHLQYTSVQDNPLCSASKLKKPSKSYTLQYKERLTSTQFSIRQEEPRSHWGEESDWSDARIRSRCTPLD